MANYTVGNLEIAFKAVDQTSTSFKDLAKNLRAIQSLINNIANADIKKFGNNIKSITADLSPFLIKIQEAETSLSSFATVTQSLGIKSLSKATAQLTKLAGVADESASSVEHIKDKVDGVVEGENQLANEGGKAIGIWEKFSDKVIKSTLLLEQQRQQALKNKIAFLELNIAHNKTGFSSEVLQNELAKLREELGQQEKATKKATNGFKRFIKSIGRIALYRAIRRALQLITQSITETIQEFAKLDDNVNATMSKITSSLQVIKLSFGATFLPLLEAIEPIISSIAIKFADFANLISQATAKGETYWAINAKAIKDYREQLQKTTGTLAGFDKFNSLNAKDDSSIFFEEREILKENKAVKETSKIIDGIKNALGGLVTVLEFIGEHLELVAIAIGGIVAFKLISKVSTLISTISGLGSVLSVLSAHPIILIVGAIAAVLTYLYATNEDFRESINNLLKALSPLLSLLTDLFNTVLEPILKNITDLVNNFIAPLATTIIKNLTNQIDRTTKVLSPIINILKRVFEWISKISDAISSVSNSIFSKIFGGVGSFFGKIGSGIGKIFGFADGGLPDRGTMFIAGEAGAEVVYNTPSGQSGVANINQLKSAFYQALVEWGSTSNNNITLNIELDGEQVYRSVTNRAQQRGKHWA